VRLQGHGRILGRRVSPQLVDETIAGDDLVRVQEEDGENSSLLRAAEVKGVLAVSDLERPKDAEI